MTLSPTPSRRRSVVVVCGLSGYGKTTFANRALLNLALSARFLFDDSPGEWNPNVGEFSDRLKVRPAQTELQLCSELVNGWVAFDPHTLFAGNLEGACDFFCEWAWEKSLRLPGQKMLVIQDAYRFCSPHFVPAPMKTIVQSGSKRGLALMIDAHEPNKLNGTITNGMSEVICFRLQGSRPLAFAEEFGFNPDEVARLDKLQFIARNLDSGGERRARIPL